MEESLTGSTRNGCTLSSAFGLGVVRTTHLKADTTMVWIVLTRVLSLVVLGFETAGAKITGAKEPRKGVDVIIMPCVVEKHQLFFLGWSEGCHVIPASGIHQQ